MPRRSQVLFLLAALLLALFGAVWLLRGHESSIPVDVTGPASGEVSPASAPVLLGRADEATAVRGAAPLDGLTPTTALRTYPADRSSGTLRGVVVDRAGRGVEGAAVTVRSVAQPQVEALAIGDDRRLQRQLTTDARGAFVVERLPEGPYVVHATREGLASNRELVAVHRGRGIVQLRLDRSVSGLDLRVHVAGEGGRDVAGATVEVHAFPYPDPAPVDGPAWRGTTNERGLATWEGVEPYGAVVWARAPDGREGLAAFASLGALHRARTQTGALEMVVAATGRLTGRVLGPDGMVPGGSLTVEAHTRNRAHGQAYYTAESRVWTTAVTKGRYRFDALPAGPYWLVVRGGNWRPLVEWTGEGRYPDPKDTFADVRSGAETELDLRVDVGGVIEGTVTMGADPVVGARVRATRDPKTSNVPDGVHMGGTHVRRFDAAHMPDADHPLTHRWTATDATGSYRIAGLEPGSYRVEVFAPGLSLGQALGVEVGLGAPVGRDFALEGAGVLQGVVQGTSYVGARRDGEVDFRVVAVVSDEGLFTFAGLPAGEYEVASPYWGQESVVLGRARVEAGRTTWVDLTAAGEDGLRGTLTIAGVPLAGAHVAYRSRRTRTDAQGHFELRWPRGWRVNPDKLEVVRSVVGRGGQHWTLPRPTSLPGLEDAGHIALGSHAVDIEVVDPDGTSLEGRVRVEARGDVRLTADGWTSPRGLAHVEGLFEADGYVATFQVENGVEVRTTFDVPRRDPVRLVVPRTGTLEIEVRRQDASPGSNTWVRVETIEEGAEKPTFATSAKTADDGRLTLRGIAVGEIYVSATRRGGFLGVLEQADARLRLEPGAHETVRLELR